MTSSSEISASSVLSANGRPSLEIFIGKCFAPICLLRTTRVPTRRVIEIINSIVDQRLWSEAFGQEYCQSQAMVDSFWSRDDNLFAGTADSGSSVSDDELTSQPASWRSRWPRSHLRDPPCKIPTIQSVNHSLQPQSQLIFSQSEPNLRHRIQLTIKRMCLSWKINNSMGNDERWKK